MEKADEYKALIELGNRLLKVYLPDCTEDITVLTKYAFRDSFLSAICNKWAGIDFGDLPSEQTLYRAFREEQYSSATKEKLALLFYAGMDVTVGNKMPQVYLDIAEIQRKQILPFWGRWLKSRLKEEVTVSPHNFESVHTEVICRYGRKDRQFWIRAAEATNDMRKRIEIYKEGLMELPGNEILLQNLAVEYANSGQQEEAFRIETEILRMWPNNADVHSNIGLHYQIVRKDYDKAEYHFKKAHELSPRHINNTGHYAWFLHSVRGRLKEAEEFYKLAIAVNPNSPSALHNYGLLLCNELFRVNDGLPFLFKANQLEPNDPTILGNIGYVYATYEIDLPLAEKYLRYATRFDPGNWIKHANYAQVLFAIGNTEEAIETYKIVRQIAGAELDCIAQVEFCLYANCSDRRNIAKRNVLDFLSRGIKTTDVNYTINIKRALKDNHPEPEILIELAEKMTDKKYNSDGQMIIPLNQ